MDDHDITQTVKTAAKEDRVIIGVNETVTALENNDVDMVILASNCPEDLRSQVADAAGDTPVHRFGRHSERLGSLCRKPFTIAVLGITPS